MWYVFVSECASEFVSVCVGMCKMNARAHACMCLSTNRTSLTDAMPVCGVGSDSVRGSANVLPLRLLLRRSPAQHIAPVGLGGPCCW